MAPTGFFQQHSGFVPSFTGYIHPEDSTLDYFDSHFWVEYESGKNLIGWLDCQTNSLSFYRPVRTQILKSFMYTSTFIGLNLLCVEQNNAIQTA